MVSLCEFVHLLSLTFCVRLPQTVYAVGPGLAVSAPYGGFQMQSTTVIDPFLVRFEARFYGPPTFFRKFVSKLSILGYHNQTYQVESFWTVAHKPLHVSISLHSRALTHVRARMQMTGCADLVSQALSHVARHRARRWTDSGVSPMDDADVRQPKLSHVREYQQETTRARVVINTGAVTSTTTKIKGDTRLTFSHARTGKLGAKEECFIRACTGL